MNKPNILMIMTDQHHADCCGYTGKRDIQTPNIDRLAEGGVNFQSAFTVHGTCVPSRTSYMTGMYPHSTGVYGNDMGTIPSSLLSVGTFLQRYGYTTGLIGKKHLPNWGTHGFQYQRLCYHADAPVRNLHYYNYLKKHNLHQWYDYLGDVEKFCMGREDVPEEHSLENWTADETINYIDSAEGPFFLMSSFERPHPPLTVPKDCRFSYDPAKIVLPENLKDTDSSFYFNRNVELLWRISKYDEQTFREAMAKYYTLITLIDYNIGRIIQKLEERNLRENTIIIFCSDHGDFGGEYGRMAKGYPYDAIHRIPFIWNCPSLLGSGKTKKGLVENVDFFPTICDLLDLPAPPSLQGKSLKSELTTDDDSGKDAVFFESVCVKTVRTKTHKLNYSFSETGETGELFDLQQDPHEYNNIYNHESCREVQADLLKRLLNWNIKTQQPPNFPRADEKFPDTRWYKQT